MGKRPGWKVQRTLYRLKFEGDQFDGLEIEARSMPLGEFFALQEMQQKANEDPGVAKEVIRRLSQIIAGWNLLGDDDEPVPATYEGLLQLELSFVLLILQAWMEAVASVPNPSLPASNGGGTSPEPSIPMEVSSPSP